MVRYPEVDIRFATPTTLDDLIDPILYLLGVEDLVNVANARKQLQNIAE